MSALVEFAEERLGSLEGRVVVDVGCNDGSLLDRFCERQAVTIGVEPTSAHEDAAGRSHNIINEYFNTLTAQKILDHYGHIDVITFTNVFAHIEDLPALLDAVELLMNDETLLIIENHYLGSVLDRNQFDTFYHEHPRTYSLHSFIEIARVLKGSVESVEFPKRYGGNIRAVISRKGSLIRNNSDIDEVLRAERQFPQKFEVMRHKLNEWRLVKKAEINDYVEANGKLVAKAFPGRAAILIELLGLTSNEVECVYEKPGSPKIGHYVPGTRIPILSDEELFLRLGDMSHILNLAWHIPEEIELYLRSHGFKGRVIAIC
ncbi:MAG: class I SAM-dependent methyltransferase [Roseicyclus sp.]|uniref:class I SAM-dependent methyltransferase n=1 Tax=Roseicyclus sp. TaxID=1914329 RepID=UPI003A8BE89E